MTLNRKPLRKRVVLLSVLVAALLAVNIVYWQDPWFWRRYVNFVGNVQNDGGLKPFDVVRGDNNYELAVATEGTRSIAATALDEAVKYAQEFGSFTLLVIHREVIQLEWYAEGWDRQRLTESQSMHKTLMGLGIGLGIEDGFIKSVEDPVGDYIDEWRNDPRGAITLRQLLQMSSGLGQYGFGLNPFGDALRWLFAGDSVTPLLATPMADWQPGTRYEYNNLNSELLGLVIERASGKRYADYLQEKVWRPMGADRAHVWLDRPNGTAHTSCCLATPAMDWAKFGIMLMNKGRVNGHRIVSEAWIDAMIEPSPSAYWYGYQIWLGYNDPPFPPGSGSTQPIASEPYDAADTFLTWGRGQQHVWVIPSRELVIVRLGPALGRQPIKPGFDVPRIPNLVMRGIIDTDAAAATSSTTRP